MARTRQLSELRTDARQRADMVSSDFCSDFEIDGYINEGITELYDLLCEVHGDEYFETETSLSTVAGQSTVNLPADFYALTGLFWQATANQQQRVEKYTPADAHLTSSGTGWYYGSPIKYRIQGGSKLRFVPTPLAVHTLTLHYIPAATRLVSDTDTLDGYGGWEELVVLHAAIKMLDKEESDVAIKLAERERVIGRIRGAADRDHAEPARVQRKRYPKGRLDRYPRGY